MLHCYVVTLWNDRARPHRSSCITEDGLTGDIDEELPAEEATNNRGTLLFCVVLVLVLLSACCSCIAEDGFTGNVVEKLHSNLCRLQVSSKGRNTTSPVDGCSR
jgi:hypothetical protein